jgi:hypothetical protein
MLSCPAALPLSRQTLDYAAGIIRRHRKQAGSPRRKLNPGRQALLVLACLRKGETFAGLAAAAARTPAAPATSRIPPCPSARASAPSSSRRCRSSRCGKIVSNFAASISLVTTMLPIPQQSAAFQEATGYFPPTP